MLVEKLKLDDDEPVLRIVRKHWFILFAQVFSFAVVALLPFVLFGVGLWTDIFASLNIDLAAWRMPILFFATAWFLALWMMTFYAWTDYYLDLWTITDRRVIAIDQRGLFNRTIASFRLERLQDLNVHIDGIIATVLNFGTLEAETASQDDAFIMRGAPDPRNVKALIQEYADQAIARRSKEPEQHGAGL